MRAPAEPWKSADPVGDMETLVRIVADFTGRPDLNPLHELPVLLGELKGYKRVLSSIPREFAMPARENA